MDSLTQIVLGAAVGEAVAGKKAGNKAMLYGAIAGTIPDLDAFASYFTDTISAIEIHRGFSHSIVFSVLAAPVFGYIISFFEKNPAMKWKDWSWLMFWGFFTHPILDSFTTWGTQFLWPLDVRLAFKSIFVIDPLYTLPFLAFLILAMRLPRGSVKRSTYNKLGILISSGYLVLGLIFKGIAYNNFVQSLKQQGIFYHRIDTRPTPFNTILWTANVETEDAFLIGYYSLLDAKMVRFDVVPKNHDYLGTLRNDRNMQRLINISKGWFTITETDGDLYFNDLRFGRLHPSDPQSPFVFSYKIIPDEETIRAEEVQKMPDEGKKIVLDLLKRIGGN